MNYPAPDYPYAGPAAHYSNRNNIPVSRIVIHGTVSPCKVGMAKIIARYFRTTDRFASAHYVVDPGETLQVVYDSKVAYHAPPNDGSIGVEICDEVVGGIERWLNRPHRRALRRTARLTAEGCLAWDVPIKRIGPKALRSGERGICGHADVSKAWGQTNHWDPGAFPWRRFLRMVKEEAAKIQGTRKATTLRKARDLLLMSIAVLADMPQRRVRAHQIEADLLVQADELQRMIEEVEGSAG